MSINNYKLPVIITGAKKKEKEIIMDGLLFHVIV